MCSLKKPFNDSTSTGRQLPQQGTEAPSSRTSFAMPDSTPKQYLDLQDLGLHEGAAVLIRRALAQMRAGEWLELRGNASGLAEQLTLWCREEGLACDRMQGAAGLYRLQANGPAPSIATSRGQIAEKAEPIWGLSPRGARVETSGPDFSFTLCQKREVWARELNAIYAQATGNQWSVSRDIAWSELPKLSPEIEDAVAQIMTFLTENEFAALYVPARFIPRIHPHYRDVVEVLAMQVVDEARHAEAFTRRALAGGAELGTTAMSS
jgi:TusA-related sulfurtransferase